MADIKMVKLSCGCKIRFYPQNTSVTQCALHEAAPKLLEACKLSMTCFQSLLDGGFFDAHIFLLADVKMLVSTLQTAVDKAAGQPVKDGE